MTLRVNLCFNDGKTEQIRLNPKALNQGADGAIHASLDGQYAIKLYHDADKDPTRQDKLWQMIATPINAHNSRHQSFTWPIALVADNKQRFLGFAMPLLDLSEHVQLEMLLSKRTRELHQLPDDIRFRIKVAINLCQQIAELHRLGHAIIDLKPANLSVNKRSAQVCIVDCDGFAIKGKQGDFPAHQYTAGFIAPEAYREQQPPQALSQAQDKFALAVILFQLLNHGLHPFQGVPKKGRELPTDNQNKIGQQLYPYGATAHPDIAPSPWSLHLDFPAELINSFCRSLTSSQRLNAIDWVELLKGLDLQLRQCSQENSHQYWGQSCPHCLQPKKNIVAPPVARPPKAAKAHRNRQRQQNRATTNYSPNIARPTSPAYIPTPRPQINVGQVLANWLRGFKLSKKQVAGAVAVSGLSVAAWALLFAMRLTPAPIPQFDIISGQPSQTITSVIDAQEQP
ncbi:protein kinase domain-containing protein [Motilimonas sp. KMU-193]|uniref:protein kinase domain-containing protein n=1 Tax=Motilimonas sp. KMU-193 TaxID=3388668 RepID=UPI00396B3DE5